jgi:hypothetical protein
MIRARVALDPGITMASIDLPRALQDYFAFAETSSTRNGRRFSITLPYLRADGRLDRLQWWYHLSAAKEMALGDDAAELLRTEAVERFITHIERWLHNTRQDLYGDGSIPHVSPAGNRLVAASQVDASASQGLEPIVDEDSPGIDEEPAANSQDAADTGEDTSSNGPRPNSWSAFG